MTIGCANGCGNHKSAGEWCHPRKIAERIAREAAEKK